MKNPAYKFIRIRVIGLVNILEGLGQVIIGHKMPALTLNLLFREAEWTVAHKFRKRQ